MKWIRSFFILLTSSLIFQHALANKIMASDIRWQCIGKDSFLIRMRVYTDCNGDPLLTSPLICKNMQTGAEITRVDMQAGTSFDITPTCDSCTRCMDSTCSFPYGIRKYTMYCIVRLDGAGSSCFVKLSWQQCCRAVTTTISGTQNYYTEAVLNRCQNPCDNAPDFCNDPIAILCTGQNFITCGGTDYDVNHSGGMADSIVYEWAPPLIAENTPIAYIAPYSYYKPLHFSGFPDDTLPFPEGFHVDRQSGTVLFQPVKNGSTQFVEKAIEYRDGKYIGEIRHEFYVIVITCPPNETPVVTTLNGIRSKSVCVNDTVSFEFYTNDSDEKDSLSIRWDNAIPGAKFIQTTHQQKHPKAIFSWVPTDVHVSSLPYTFRVAVFDNACPVSGYSTISCQIYVKPKPRAVIFEIDSGAGEFWFVAMKIEGADPTYLWEGENFSFTPNTGQIVSHTFKPGTYPYTMTMVAKGCTNKYFDTLEYDTTVNVRSQEISEPDFNVYPNPASGYVNITYKGQIKWEGRLLLFDEMSRQLMNISIKFDVNNSSINIPLDSFKPGIYLVKLQNNSGNNWSNQLIIKP